MISLIQHRRSCRNFSAELVDLHKTEALKKALLWSPTSKNNRPWEFVFVDDPVALKRLSECKPHGAAFLSKAPLGIVILADPAKSDVWVEDTAIAATLLQLSAEALGLGSCWIQVRKRQHASGQKASEFIKQVINAPEHLEVCCILAIGYKLTERPPYEEDDLLMERIHVNGF